MRSLIIFLAAIPPVAYAYNYVSGTGRLSSDLTQNVEFNLGVYSSSIESALSSIHDGPNRTSAAALPVTKLHGVNVNTRASRLFFCC